jgi:hypothetical protein
MISIYCITIINICIAINNIPVTISEFNHKGTPFLVFGITKDTIAIVIEVDASGVTYCQDFT